MEQYKLDDVYGMARRRLPLTYVERPNVDHRLLNELSRDNHIVIYGSSKQGKTSLLMRTLEEGDYVVAHCATDWTKEKLYSTILRQLGVALTDSTTRARGRSEGIQGELGAELGMSVMAKFKANLKLGANQTTTVDETVVERELPIDLSNASDVIQVLDGIGYEGLIVVEDFHYLPVDVQKDLAGDLKAFYERSPISFIIVGVWLEANRLIVYNGDLAHRLTSIPADTWTPEDLTKVVRTGESYMNARFDDDVVTELVKRSQGNVGQLQEALRQIFLARQVYVTASETVTFNNIMEVHSAYEYVAEQLAGRYANSINKFSEGLRDQTLHMYKWIMHAVISASPDERRAGLKAMDIVRHVQEHHPKGSDIYANNVHSALTNVSKVQSHADITPVIFDYDLTHKRLTVVDNGFHVYLEGTPWETAMSYLAVFANEEAEKG